MAGSNRKIPWIEPWGLGMKVVRLKNFAEKKLENVVTIREFNTKLCQLLGDVVTSGKDLTVTRYRKPYIVVTIPSNVVTIKPVIKIKKEVITTKSEVIEGLRQKTQEIITKEEPGAEEVKHSCAVCKKLFRRDREAVEEIELLSNDVYCKDWVCQEHKAKYALC